MEIAAGHPSLYFLTMTGDGATPDYMSVPREGHFAAIVASSLDAIVSKDLDGRVQSWNSSAERIFGWAATDMIGNSIRTLIPADRQHEEDDILGRIRRGEIVPKFETLRQHRDGRLVPVAITVSPILDEGGRIVGASKIANDISETVAMRERLYQSELEFRTLADNISQLAWMADREGSIFWYNKRWFDFTGTSLQEMQGWGWRAVHHPDHVDRVVEKISCCFANGEAWEDVFPLRGADGEYRWFLSRAEPIRADDGSISRWFGTNTDVTKQREDEQRIEMLMGEVSHRAKNMMAVIQAIVSRTADKHFAEGFTVRLQALAANQDLLVRRNWTGAPIGALISSQLASVADLIGSRIHLVGDMDLVLLPAAAETIGLAIHELATNALKYGAISSDAGEIGVSWVVVEDGSEGPRLRISWVETGGPPVTPPSRRGFGTMMFEHSPRIALSATVTTDYLSEGFRWTADAPAGRVLVD